MEIIYISCRILLLALILTVKEGKSFLTRINSKFSESMRYEQTTLLYKENKLSMLSKYVKEINKNDGRRVTDLDNFVVVDSFEDYKATVLDEKEKIVVVRFFAKWCKSCREIAPLFHNIRRKNPNLLFVEVPILPNNVDLRTYLGLEYVPFCHIYHPSAGLVEQLNMSKDLFPTFTARLKWYINGFCEINY